ncbi:MAG: hypothetical protein FJ042_06130 [Candidatus Cloacimonetes bacterium]|nr:hypothetical protein [Candidatus Cloacimonadota bacterium]
MRKSVLYTCELKQYRQITASLCAVCPRLENCRAFRLWYKRHSAEYISFVTEICIKFPEKYTMEVFFMAEKHTYIQIVDARSGNIERIVDFAEIEALSTEEKLALSRGKQLFIVTHRLEPIVKVEMRKTTINEPVNFGNDSQPEPEEPIKPEPEKPVNPKGRK